jgi:hypothetical protein
VRLRELTQAKQTLRPVPLNANTKASQSTEHTQKPPSLPIVLTLRHVSPVYQRTYSWNSRSDAIFRAKQAGKTSPDNRDTHAPPSRELDAVVFDELPAGPRRLTTARVPGGRRLPSHGERLIGPVLGPSSVYAPGRPMVCLNFTATWLPIPPAVQAESSPTEY